MPPSESRYVERVDAVEFYRGALGGCPVPARGVVEITERCNNTCLHCFINQPQGGNAADNEITFDECRHYISDAIGLGCRRMGVTGGEPLLREYAIDLCEWLALQRVSVVLSTNGTLLTGEMVKRLIKSGTVVHVTIYGATERVHDRVTRCPGSYAATLKGLALLRDMSARCVVFFTPMRANFHEFQEALMLAHSFSPHVRLGSAWIFSRHWRDCDVRSREVCAQRLSADEVARIEPQMKSQLEMRTRTQKWEHCGDGRIHVDCGRDTFAINASGGFQICAELRHPDTIYDLRKGSFREAWLKFLPELQRRVMPAGPCHECDLRPFCFWCFGAAWRETGTLNGKVEYLCEIAKEARRLFVAQHGQENKSCMGNGYG